MVRYLLQFSDPSPHLPHPVAPVSDKIARKMYTENIIADAFPTLKSSAKAVYAVVFTDEYYYICNLQRASASIFALQKRSCCKCETFRFDTDNTVDKLVKS